MDQNKSYSNRQFSAHNILRWTMKVFYLIICQFQYYDHCHTHHLSVGVTWLVDVDRVEVCHPEVLPVESLREVVYVVDKEATVIDGDGLADTEVSRSEVFLDLLVSQLHDNVGERGGHVVTVLGHLQYNTIRYDVGEGGGHVVTVLGHLQYNTMQYNTI